MVIQAPEFKSDLGEDLFNKTLLRDRSIIPMKSYNCAGFALETFTWYMPYFNECYNKLCAFGDEELFYKNELEYISTCLTTEFDDIRILKTPTELNEDEYLIACRLAEDEDFHFMKKVGEHWVHKIGNRDIYIYDEDINEPWHMGYYLYDSPILYLAKRKSDISERELFYTTMCLNPRVGWYNLLPVYQLYHPNCKFQVQTLDIEEEDYTNFSDLRYFQQIRELQLVEKFNLDVAYIEDFELPDVIGTYNRSYENFKDYEKAQMQIQGLSWC